MLKRAEDEMERNARILCEKIVEMLKKEGCIVAEAKIALNWASREIDYVATLQNVKDFTF